MKNTKMLLYAIPLMIALMNVGSVEAVLITYDGTGHDINDEILDFYSGLPGNPVHSEGFEWVLLGTTINPVFGPHSGDTAAFSGLDNPVSIDWSLDVNKVSFFYGYNEPLSIQGFHQGEQVFDSGTLPQNSNGMFQFKAAPDTAIDHLVFNGTPESWTIDDLSYDIIPGSSVVPEPASALILGAGFMGMIGFRKKNN